VYWLVNQVSTRILAVEIFALLQKSPQMILRFPLTDDLTLMRVCFFLFKKLLMSTHQIGTLEDYRAQNTQCICTDQSDLRPALRKQGIKKFV
jgi:hypothetical protein